MQIWTRLSVETGSLLSNQSDRAPVKHWPSRWFRFHLTPGKSAACHSETRPDWNLSWNPTRARRTRTIIETRTRVMSRKSAPTEFYFSRRGCSLLLSFPSYKLECVFFIKVRRIYTPKRNTRTGSCEMRSRKAEQAKWRKYKRWALQSNGDIVFEVEDNSLKLTLCEMI